MIAMHLVLWLVGAGAVVLIIAVARLVFLGGYDQFGEFPLAPGDIDAGYYLASGRVAWTPARAPRSGRSGRRARRS